MGCSHSLTLINREPTDFSKGNTSGQPRATTFKLNANEIRLVNETWKVLSTDMTGYGSQVFLRIFERNPKIKQLFPCRDVEGDDLLKDINFKGHASRFMQALGAAVDNINCLEQTLAPLLLGLGRRHAYFVGFKEDYFEFFVEGVMFVLSQELKGKFDFETKLAWKTIFDFIMLHLKEGYRLQKAENHRESL